MYKLFAEKNVNILIVVQKIAKEAKSLNESLYAKKEVNNKNKNLPDILPKRFIKPKLFFIYFINIFFKSIFYTFSSLLKNNTSINEKNINPQCLDKMFSVKKFNPTSIQNDTLKISKGNREILNK